MNLAGSCSNLHRCRHRTSHRASSARQSRPQHPLAPHHHRYEQRRGRVRRCGVGRCHPETRVPGKSKENPRVRSGCFPPGSGNIQLGATRSASRKSSLVAITDADRFFRHSFAFSLLLTTCTARPILETEHASCRRRICVSKPMISGALHRTDHAFAIESPWA